MGKNYDREAQRIVEDIRKNPGYRGYEFDREIGLFRGPYSGPEVDRRISDKEAIIGMKQQISRMAQKHMLLVEKNDSGKWQVKEVLLRREG